MNPARADTSRIGSPRDPMTSEERETVRLELREEMAWLDGVIAKHGDPWGGLRPNWANVVHRHLIPSRIDADPSRNAR